MQILVVAATTFEIAAFLEAKPEADHLITGVGAPMAIYHLTKRLQQIDYDLVIQAGIAGSFKESLKPDKLVFVKQDCFADLGVNEKHEFSTIFDMGFADKNDFPFNKGWLKNTSATMDLFPLPKEKGVTVNTITDNEKQTAQLISTYHPHIETMEGAALHYVCLQENVPFLQLRAISNKVGERDKSKWKLKEAITKLNDGLIKIVNHLSGGEPTSNKIVN